MSLILYDHELDENCYRVRLMLSLLGLQYERRAVDVFPGKGQKGPELLKLNPAGELPILEDGDLVLSEAPAILAYLARRHDASGHWLPLDPPRFGAVMRWLAFASSHLGAASLARLHAMMEVPADAAAVMSAAKAAFRIMEDAMIRREFEGAAWFVGDGPTIADIALFPSIALSRDAGIEHDAYPALRRWIRHVRALPGFRTMPGIPEFY